MPRDPSQVLIIEDEIELAKILGEYFERDGFNVDHVTDGRTAVGHALRLAPDLIVLDIMLPGLSGLDICRALREHSTVPIIMTTARVEELDRLLGLELGADDYVCKPYSPREVVARAKTILRRVRLSASPCSATHPALISIDDDAWAASIEGNRIDLTRKEFLLLRVLVKRPGRVFSRDQLLDLAYQNDDDVQDRVVDSHIKNIRRKIGDLLPGREVIRSLYGVGYCYDE